MQIAVNGLNFDVETAGAQGAPMVLLLHGFPQTSYTWRHQLEPLAKAGYFAVAPNQRGYSAGARPQGVSAYATENLLLDARGMIAHFGYDGAHIVGHDWGGQLSWLLAAHHADEVKSLTVLSRPHPQAFLRAMREDDKQAQRSRHHKLFQDADAARPLLAEDAARLRSMFADQGVGSVDQDAYLNVLGEFAALDAAIDWYRAPVQSGASQPLAAHETPDVGVPTLYIWGDADATVGRVAAEGTAAHVTGPYRFEVLSRVGHFVTDQAGAQVSEILLEFLESLENG